jgi:cation diffusion facilitator family transporter
MATRDPQALSHQHVFLSAKHDDHARRTWWVVALAAVMMVGEIVAGIAFNSMALLADGFHMATHVGALAIAAMAYAFARRHAHDRRFTFGTGKVGDLAGFASALILGIVALGIGVESLLRFMDPHPVAFTEATLVAVLGLIVNVVSAWLLSGGHHHHDHAHGHDVHHHDNNMRSAFTHVLADALTSVLAIAALLAGRFFGWIWLDPVMGIVGAGVIAVWSWNLMRDAAAVLLDRTDPQLEAEIRVAIENGSDVRITDLHVWRVGPAAHAAIVSVTGAADGEAVRARLAPVHELAHVTVEVR